jgi:hypothetical protein
MRTVDSAGEITGVSRGAAGAGLVGDFGALDDATCSAEAVFSEGAAAFFEVACFGVWAIGRG